MLLRTIDDCRISPHEFSCSTFSGKIPYLLRLRDAEIHLLFRLRPLHQANELENKI